MGIFSSSSSSSSCESAICLLPFAQHLTSTVPRLKNLLQVAGKGWKQLLQALVLTILVIFPYSVWGLNLWAGKFYSCNDPAVIGRENCFGDFLLQLDTGAEGTNLSVWVPRVWSNPFYYNFDTVFQSFFTLFKMSSEEAWLDVFTTARNTNGYNMNPGRQTHDAAIIYFFPYMVLAFLVVNVSPPAFFFSHQKWKERKEKK